MAEENVNEDQETPVSGALDDATNPHPVDEDPEQCLGKLIKDPWNDDKQEDWPNADLEPEVTE